MERYHVHSPATVAELKKLLNELPDDMEISALTRGQRTPINLSVQLRGAGKGKENTTVTRGGVPFLAAHDWL
ncbi:hypothetical protein [Paraburkholderia sp. SIMBA_054]|uniref:hypothetical protein n=1 Tax=Paraburkholderia sp. SIMBA_054 TaxID=3085795 RepID=UPI003978D9F4